MVIKDVMGGSRTGESLSTRLRRMADLAACVAFGLLVSCGSGAPLGGGPSGQETIDHVVVPPEVLAEQEQLESRVRERFGESPPEWYQHFRGMRTFSVPTVVLATDPGELAGRACEDILPLVSLDPRERLHVQTVEGRDLWLCDQTGSEAW